MSADNTLTGSPPGPPLLPHASPQGGAVLMIPLMLVLFVTNLDQTSVAVALPSIAADLHGTADASWVVTAYLLTGAVTTLIFGKLGDMFGRKRVLQIALAAFVLGSLLCAVADSITALVLFRALQGVGGLTSLVLTITGDLVPARQRATYQAATVAVSMVALVAGPLLGGAFSQGLSWRWIFYVNLPIGVVAFLSIGALLHLPHRRSTAQPDIAGALAVTVFTTAALLATTWGGHTHPWSSPPVLGLMALSLIALAVYLAVERRAAAPITPLHLFRSGAFSLAAVQYLIATLVLFAAMLYVPMFLQSVQNRSAVVAGMFVVPLLVGLVAVTLITGPLITRSGRYKPYPVAGAAFAAAAMYCLGQADRNTSDLALLLPLMAAGAGLGLVMQVCLLAGQNAVDHRDLGAATSTLVFFRSMGGAFGAAVFGAVLSARLADVPAAAGDHSQAFQLVFLLTVPCLLLSFALALLMEEKPLAER
ncbi:MDR family MFS transporter [Streptomyces sp. NPDC056773]|uniref:MDR family MFS transporter n=1 Tax=unclassified Streptomyces TaxID=2593676 RepID=UPI003677A12F